MSVIDTLITNRSSAVPHNNTDLNRVGLAVNYVAGIFATLGYDTSGVVGRTDYPISYVYTREELEVYRSNVTILRGMVLQLSSTPAAPASIRFLTFEQANAIEQILVACDDELDRMAKSWFYTGEIGCGEV